MKIGILGGTFDPIHIGHLIIAEHACEQLHLDKLLIIPAAVPPHKQGEKITNAKHRLQMAKLAAKSNSKFIVSDIELKKSGVSYSIETLELIKRKMGKSAVYYLIIGSDMVPDLYTWKDIGRLTAMCKFIVAIRPGFMKKELKKMKLRLPVVVRKRVLSNIMLNPLVDISSTDIRERIGKRRSIRYMVPEKVEKYIIKHRLYKK
jgi:nicotinate-nucleotide adenylyltransferase